MAEYITKEQAIKTACEDSCTVYNCFDRQFNGCNTIKKLKTLPTADVVERSKIDKAIEEIKAYSREFLYEDSAFDYGVKMIEIDKVIQILKNIGEE